MNFTAIIKKAINYKNRLLYFHPSSKDIFIVSYPRSGSTWMRTLLTYLVHGINTYNLDDLDVYSPSIYKNIKRKNMIKSEYKIIKSHDPFKRVNNMHRLYEKVIYI